MSASFEVEMTPEEAALIEKAASALGCGVEEFARAEVVLAARRELGDRREAADIRQAVLEGYKDVVAGRVLPLEEDLRAMVRKVKGEE